MPTLNTLPRIARDTELATFYVGDVLMGVPINHVQEINRHQHLTPAPQAPDAVRGVINLRGQVVTVVDLKAVLQLGNTEISRQTRNVIVGVKGEEVALLVDRVADVVQATGDRLEAPPANVGGADGRFFLGVYKLDAELLLVLNVEEVLSAAAESL